MVTYREYVNFILELCTSMIERLPEIPQSQNKCLALIKTTIIRKKPEKGKKIKRERKSNTKLSQNDQKRYWTKTSGIQPLWTHRQAIKGHDEREMSKFMSDNHGNYRQNVAAFKVIALAARVTIMDLSVRILKTNQCRAFYRQFGTAECRKNKIFAK